MPTRSIDADGKSWLVFPSGRITQYDRDEFSLVFVHGTGPAREVRVNGTVLQAGDRIARRAD